MAPWAVDLVFAWVVGPPLNPTTPASLPPLLLPLSNAFVRKVFGILAVQLVFTVGIAAMCMYVPSIRKTVQNNPFM